MTIIVLIMYLIFLLIFSVASFFALNQLIRYGFVGDASKKSVGIYILVSLTIIIASFVVFLILS